MYYNLLLSVKEYFKKRNKCVEAEPLFLNLLRRDCDEAEKKPSLSQRKRPKETRFHENKEANPLSGQRRKEAELPKKLV